MKLAGRFLSRDAIIARGDTRLGLTKPGKPAIEDEG